MIIKNLCIKFLVYLVLKMYLPPVSINLLMVSGWVYFWSFAS